MEKSTRKSCLIFLPLNHFYLIKFIINNLTSIARNLRFNILLIYCIKNTYVLICISYNTFHVKTFLYSGVFAWWHEMSDVSKGAVIGGSILFVIILIICCYCCCCRSRPNNRGGVIFMPSAGGPSVLTTRNNANVAI